MVQPLWRTSWRFLKKLKMGTSLGVQWLRLQVSTAAGREGFDPWSETEIPQAEKQLNLLTETIESVHLHNENPDTTMKDPL